MLELRDCFAAYAGRRVLEDVTLSLGSGRTGCIVGPSGCGKTTLLMLASGLKQPEAGQVLLDGMPVAAGDRRAGLILQQYGLFPWFTARENVALGLRIRGVGAAARRAAADRELDRVGLAGMQGRYPAEMSGGQQQRVAIARSMALEPSVLLMDEPFSALDAMSRESLQEILLASLRQRSLTVLLVTHSIEEAVYLGAAIWLLAGTPGRIIARFDNPDQGSVGHRTDPSFFRTCSEIRRTMEGTRVV